MVEGGIGSIAEARQLTFREIDLRLQRERKIVEDGWDYTRSIISALTGKSPRSIIRLDRDPKPFKWTQEEAIATIKRYGEKWPK